jgi:hypothetical protein
MLESHGFLNFPAGPLTRRLCATANARTGQGLSVVPTVGGGRQRADAHELITGIACKLAQCPLLAALACECVCGQDSLKCRRRVHSLVVLCDMCFSVPPIREPCPQPACASPRHDRGSSTRSVERPLCRSHPWHAQRGALLAPLLTSPHLLAYGFLGLLGEGACMIRLSVLQCTHNSG